MHSGMIFFAISICFFVFLPCESYSMFHNTLNRMRSRTFWFLNHSRPIIFTSAFPFLRSPSEMKFACLSDASIVSGKIQFVQLSVNHQENSLKVNYLFAKLSESCITSRPDRKISFGVSKKVLLNENIQVSHTHTERESCSTSQFVFLALVCLFSSWRLIFHPLYSLWASSPDTDTLLSAIRSRAIHLSIRSALGATHRPAWISSNILRILWQWEEASCSLELNISIC